MPKLDFEAAEVARAFRLLSKTRTVGMDVNPISLQEVHYYVLMFGYPWFGLDMFVDLLTDMDVHFRTVHSEGQDKAKTPPKSEEIEVGGRDLTDSR